MYRPLAPASGIPVKVTLRAKDGRTLEARDLADKQQGEINQFVAAARQRFGDLAFGSAIKSITGGDVRFIKNGGQETLTITLEPPVADDAAQQAPTLRPERLPDYCIVDAVISGGVAISANFAAVGVAPAAYLGQPFAGEIEIDYSAGVTTYSESVGATRALMRFSRHDDSFGELPITDRVASLKIDLRRVSPGQDVVIEIWGRLTEAPGLPTTSIIKDFEVPFTALPTSEGVAYKNAGSSEWYWPDGSGAPHDERIFTNTLAAQQSISADVQRSFPTTLYAASIAAHLDTASWDETIETPVADGQTLVSRWTQQRFDPDTGLVLAQRRFFYGFTYTIGADDEDPTRTRAQWVLQPFEQTRLFTITENTEPTDDLPVDVVASLYYDDPNFQRTMTPNEDAAGIWAINATMPEREYIGGGLIYGEDRPGSQAFPDLDDPLALIGTVTVRRAELEMFFESA